MDTLVDPFGIMYSRVKAQPVVAIIADPKTGGYRLVDRAGHVYSYGAS
jgi:hypothetical protein